ncbi:flagellar motor switch protein FliN [Cryobacterium roopkundense]|uniref:Flagellar motor switch protein FliN n=1 Tax=Cryobacterium roopkundense TaxID=1001240 RepID=A0A099J2U1_9MICO|nr:flagellar motor switch protein FliN [Cryobacterium roopkundense]KGJ71862.1 flagellar motor switch protein FliN [Cryobacterium roopkundense]MBB5640833.1 flagellar motor switch protein FliN/FliY [Cryobacterium roopkundense]
MTDTGVLSAAAVDALIRVLPTGVPLRAVETHGSSALSARVGSAAVASFVGATSADLAIVLMDPAAFDAASGSASALVASHDVLRPSLESAAGVLGVGVLGDTRVEDASSLFMDAETRVFELGAAGQVSGWFALRVRKNGAATGGAPGSTSSAVSNLGRINNVWMALTVEIGHTRMPVRDVLSLEPGAVIELDRSAGAPADVMLNGRLIAHGEIVVVDQDYAIRITQILDVVEGAS